MKKSKKRLIPFLISMHLGFASVISLGGLAIPMVKHGNDYDKYEAEFKTYENDYKQIYLNQIAEAFSSGTISYQEYQEMLDIISHPKFKDMVAKYYAENGNSKPKELNSNMEDEQAKLNSLAKSAIAVCAVGIASILGMCMSPYNENEKEKQKENTNSKIELITT